MEVTDDDNRDNSRDGVAIAVEKSPIPHIHGIYRIHGRMMELRIESGDPLKSPVLNASAPHIGYSAGAIGNIGI